MFKLVVFYLIFLHNTLFALYMRDDTSETILNVNSMLMWQDTSESKILDKTWLEALEYCENLTLAGFNDWRLPNINELITISDHNLQSPAIHYMFVNIEISSASYWSSTTFKNTTTQSWYVDFRYGDIKTKEKTESLKVRCVRNFN